eukprot:TRINITY_DN6051_c0_g1_i7.p1 TRINITY_DN6051_c0_g1~~TRINITY_DN6051_c0_g1_i7.p1  ORF type:complete len:102 (-),score=25.23 TRINITY_DN6051_c0_g1_i7:828-1109(-)
MIRRPPRSTRKESSAASDVYKRQVLKKSSSPPRVPLLYPISVDFRKATSNTFMNSLKFSANLFTASLYSSLSSILSPGSSMSLSALPSARRFL